MPKYEFEGSIVTVYSGEVEASSREEAYDIVKSEMDFYDDLERYTEIDWLYEVED